MTKDEIKVQAVWMYLTKHHTLAETERILYPLQWYLFTGRAGYDFRQAFHAAKPFMVARRLEKASTDEEAINNLYLLFFGTDKVTFLRTN